MFELLNTLKTRIVNGFVKQNKDLEKAGNYWAQRARKAAIPHSRFYESELIRKHINKKLCGKSLPNKNDGYYAFIRANIPERLQHGISVGCGRGGKEMNLIEANLVERFDLVEINQELIDTGKELAREKGIQDKVNFIFSKDTNFPDTTGYDLVHWDASLHHMPDVLAALEWSYNALRPGGWIIMNEYVGPNFFQWTPTSLEWADNFRKDLDERYFIQPNGKMGKIATPRVNKEQLIAKDPTEAQDSERIVESFNRVFPDGNLLLTGGAAYHVAIRGIFHNFDEVDDADKIAEILKKDDDFIEQGETHFAIGVAQKPQ